MIIPIRCITCGRLLADKWKAFKKRVKKGENPKKVLDDLDIKNYCCRSLFLTHRDISKEIAKFKKMQ